MKTEGLIHEHTVPKMSKQNGAAEKLYGKLGLLNAY